ncbi:MAG TPA: small multi-drug export protein [Patescibacteria group bacterium]|nr:small multi-drug export protein [Patescibacteria group bacterium]
MLLTDPVSWFVHLPPELATFFISMIPITELRASIPIGIEVYGLPVWKVFVLAVIGDLIPALLILICIPFVHDWIMRSRILGAVLEHKLRKAEKKFSGNYFKYGAIALVIFIGIPLPFTGSWTGALIAFVFNIPFRRAAPLITVGVLMAASIVTAVTLFAGGTLRWLF